MNPIMVDDYASLFNCTAVVRASDSMTASSKSFNEWTGLDDLSLACPAVVQLVVSFNSGSHWTLPRVLFFFFVIS